LLDVCVRERVRESGRVTPLGQMLESL